MTGAHLELAHELALKEALRLRELVEKPQGSGAPSVRELLSHVGDLCALVRARGDAGERLLRYVDRVEESAQETKIAMGLP